MAESFDPYRHWLGIPTGERPPNHYALLGLSLYEDDADAIANAADRQMAYVRTHQTGPHSAATQQLLNELAAARLRLLNLAEKARYDADLKAKYSPVPTPVALAAHVPPTAARIEPRPIPQNVPHSVPPIAVAAPAVRGAARQRSTSTLTSWPAPAAGGLVAGALLTWLLMSLGRNEPVEITKTEIPAPLASHQPADQNAAESPTKPTPAKSSDKPKTAPIFTSIERPPQLGVLAEKLVIWNTHSGVYKDRGTLECNVRLMSGRREAWHQADISIPWAADEDRNITIALPPKQFDAVRVEITKWEGLGGGLAEIEVLAADGRNLALGCPALASGINGHRFEAERVVDGITTSAESDTGYWLLRERAAGWIEVDLSLPRPAKLVGVAAEKLVIWNQHNGPHNNSATKLFDVKLYSGTRTIWQQEQLELPWVPGEDTSADVRLPASKFDRVRINVTPPEGKWAGLSEVQIIHDGRNVALDCPATASAVYDEWRRETRVTDGIVSSNAENVGYWLLPQHSPGWVQVDLACLDPDYGEACRRLGLALAAEGDWRRSLPWLARGDQQALRRLAQADRQDWIDTPERLAIADAWWNWAQQAAGELRQRLLARSLWRYSQALSRLHEYRKNEVQTRLDQALPELPERDALFFMSETELKSGDGSFREMPVVVRGEPSPYGLFLHAVPNGSSHAAFHLQKRYRRFHGAAAINDSAGNRTATELTFRIVGDGRELWKSPPLKGTGASEAFDLDVSGVEKLELLVDCPGANDWGHAAWFEPRLRW